MKNIDDNLKSKSLKPCRELSDDFTDKVLVEIKSGRARAGVFRSFKAKFAAHTILFSTVTALLVGSTAAAAVLLWPTPKVTPTLTKTLPNGNRIVAYDTNNCYFIYYQPGKFKASDGISYYEINKGANLSVSQIQDMLLASCRDNIAGNYLTAVQQRLASPAKTIQLPYNYVVQKIAGNQLDITLDQHYGDSGSIPTNLNFTKISSNVVAYDQASKIPFSAIQPGDSVRLIVRILSGETFSDKNYQPFSDPSKLEVVAIVKVPKLNATPVESSNLMGKVITIVHPCTTDSSGFCQN